jgi:Cu/Ag efflux protein CusF
MEVLSPAAPAAQTYTTPGVVERVPGDAVPYLTIRHETIPDFLDKDGKVIGMPAHAMEFFAVSPAIDLSKLKAGQKVLLTFEVRWGPDEPRALVTKLEPRAE